MNPIHCKNSKLLTSILMGTGLVGGTVLSLFLGENGARAQSFTPDDLDDLPKPIQVRESLEPLEERLQRTITLDIRDMNIVDVIKFLALKAEFNVVISPSVEGRVTVYLTDVAIQDAMDIVFISNRLAYYVDNDIVHAMSESEFENLFGRQFANKTQVTIIRLKYTRPSYVLAALDNIKSNKGKIIIDEDTGSVVLIDTPEALAAMLDAIEEFEQPLQNYVYSLQYAEADVLANTLQSRIDSKGVGSITSDERTNQLLVRAFPSRIEEIEAIIKKLDSPTKEVLIEGRILQVVLKPKYDAGIDWQLDFRKSSLEELKKITFRNIYLNENSLATSSNLVNKFAKIGVGNFDVDQFQLAIRALEQVSDTKILSNPRILVTNGEEAKIHIGDTVPYIISTTSGTGDNAITSEDVRFVDVGLKLNVAPSINDDGFVTMRLRPEISTVVGQITSKGGGIPQVNKTELETTVMVEDGNTIIMGGLKKQDKVHSKQGLPVLMHVPIIDKIFSRTADTLEVTEIVIFITPHIVMGTESYQEVDRTIKPFKPYDEKLSANIETEDKGSGL